MLELLHPQTNINLESLLKQVTDDILNRPYYETYKGYEEDEGLLGLLNVASAIYKKNQPFVLEEENIVSLLFFLLYKTLLFLLDNDSICYPTRYKFWKSTNLIFSKLDQISPNLLIGLNLIYFGQVTLFY